ncbi:hypothetical protein N7536_009776, partial [Penicillium majusculum]
AVWPSGLRRLTRNQFRSRAHVRIMQPSCFIFFLHFIAMKRIYGFDQVRVLRTWSFIIGLSIAKYGETS